MVEEFRLILRGERCAAKVNAKRIRAFFRDLTAALRMNLWKGPWAWEMADERKEPGFSGGVFWTESGCQLHHFASEAKVTVDIYSCEYFNIMDAQKLFEEYFKPTIVTGSVPILTHWKG